MKFSKTTLSKMKKDELIELVLELQNSQKDNSDPFGDIRLTFKRNFIGYGNDKRKKYGFIVSGKGKVLYIQWNKYVPSGYSDNGIKGSFEITLNKTQLSKIEKQGFTKEVILPLIKSKCEAETYDYDEKTSDLMAA